MNHLLNIISKKIGLPLRQYRVKTPTLLQIETVECGAVVLGIVLAYYGRIIPLPELRSRCGVSRDGSTLANLKRAAENLGMEAKGFRKTVAELRLIAPPYIVHWNSNHFVVVEGFKGDHLFLNDPITGPRVVTAQEFAESYSGVVLILRPTATFQKGGKKPSTIASLVKRLRGSSKEIVFCILTNMLLVLPGMAIAVFAQVFIDQVLIQDRTEWIRPMLWGMGLIAFIQTALIALQLQKLRYLQLRLSIQMTGQFLWHTLCLPVDFYAQRFAGEISSRIGLNNQVAGLLSGTLARSAIDGIIAFFFVALMIIYDPVLTAIAIFSVSANLLTLRWVARLRTDSYARLNQDVGKITGVEISGLQSMETIKATALESTFFAKWSGHYAKVISAQQLMLKGDLILNTLPTFLNSVSSMLLLVIGGWRVMDGHLTIGMLIAVQGLINRFQQPISNLLDLGNQLQQLSGSLNRLDDVLQNPIDPSLQQPPITTDLHQHDDITQKLIPPFLRGAREDQNLMLHPQNNDDWAIAVDLHRLKGYVELRNVTFGYSSVREPLIKNFSCSLKPGQRIAFVGSSGSGKSTIAKLIAGLYQPWEGEILFDGMPRPSIPRSVITNSLAMVEQDIFLFGGTVADNLTLWDETIPDAQLIQACRDAAILDVVMSIPKGLKGELLEGANNLSGGQRQRLEIARALVNNPAILVMDEASSALDTETERYLDRQIRRRGCTCVMVAHRLSTIRNCDEIVVLEQGKVVERGTHDQLMALNEHYAHLWRSA